ncbi:MAG: dipeptidyl carboxypeptidase II, partial [Planctomycetota bacterium]
MRPIAISTLLLAAVAATTAATVAQDSMTATALPKDNPFAAPSSLPYATPAFDQVRDAHYLPALTEGMRLHREEVVAIATQKDAPTFENTIEALEKAGTLLTRVSKVFFNLTESTTNPIIQSVQAEVAPKLAAHADAIWLDAQLFARVEAVHAAREQLG